MQGSQAYRDYLAGDSCRVLEAEREARSTVCSTRRRKSTSDRPSGRVAAGHPGRAARKSTRSSARRASARTRTGRYAAGYYCFVAGAIMSPAPARAATNRSRSRFRTNHRMPGHRPDGIEVYSASRVEELKLAWPSLRTCKPWCSNGRAQPLKAAELPVPEPGPERDPHQGRGLRRVPHRSAYLRRRAAASQAAARSRP